MSTLIHATELHHGYGDVDVLCGVELSVNPGERVAITGPSGCGKSTLLHLLAGLERPTRGRVYLCGQDVSAGTEDTRAALRRTHIGLMFQDHHLLPHATALENTLLPCMAVGAVTPTQTARAQDLLTRLGLAERSHHLPHALSTGQRQRVAVARALMLSPDVVLADEPTGSLDPERATDLLTLLHEVGGETAIVIVTHDTRIAASMDRHLRLVSGVLTAGSAG